jgi:hypothetical protein
MGAHQPGAAASIELTGQSGKTKLQAVGEHCPGGPTTAEPDYSDVSLASSYNALRLGPEPHGSGPVAKLGRGLTSSPHREAEAELGLGC